MSVNVLDGNGNLKKIAHGFPESKFNVLRADIIENIESTDTASKNYAVGDYLIMANGQLVKVINAISEDSVITSNDVQAITVEEMIAAKADLADIVDAVTDGDMRAVTSNAVHDALESKISTSETTGLVKNDGSIDTKSYAEKVANGTENNLAGLDANGNLKDGGWSSDKTTTSATGNPISITGLKSNQLAKNPIITLEPMQDLHGQSKPYPAGGGKNIFDGGYSESGKYLNQDGTLTNGSSWYVTNYIPVKSGISYTLSHSSTTSNNGICWYDESKTYIDGSLWGSSTIKTITLPSNAKYIRASYYANWISTFQIEEGNQATSYAPYENICPISGYDKIEVLSCGKNLFDVSKMMVGMYDQDNWHMNDNTLYRSYRLRLKAGTYVFSSSEQLQMVRKVVNGVLSTISGYTSYVLTVDSDAEIGLSFQRPSSQAWGTTPNIQLEESTSATTYVPYVKATSISESLGQTVYGGSLDVRTGKLSGDAIEYVFTGNETWVSTWEGQAYSCSCLTSNPGVSNANQNNVYKCEIADPKSVNDLYANLTGVAVNGVSIFISADLYASISSFTGKKVIYKGITPFTIQLTPHEISLLSNYAYVSTNGTTIALDYHNGELASLADVSQLGETVNLVGNDVSALTAELKELKTTLNRILWTLATEHPVVNNGTDNGAAKLMLDYRSTTNKITVYKGNTVVGNITLGS